jgi:hypothetical protein
MQTPLNKHDVTVARQRLIELTQRINFGRIEQLLIADGDPVLTPPPLVIREIKFGGENGLRLESEISDFILKSQVVELLRFLDEFRDGAIDVLEIKHGLPFRMLIREAAA